MKLVRPEIPQKDVELIAKTLPFLVESLHCNVLRIVDIVLMVVMDKVYQDAQDSANLEEFIAKVKRALPVLVPDEQQPQQQPEQK